MVRPCVARECRRVVGSGLASMYPVFDWSIVLRAIMEISALAISLAERPRGPFVPPVFAGAGKTEPPSRLILSHTSAGTNSTTREQSCSLKLAHLEDPTGPRARTLQACGRVCWRAQSPARCGAAVSWLPRPRATLRFLTHVVHKDWTCRLRKFRRFKHTCHQRGRKASALVVENCPGRAA